MIKKSISIAAITIGMTATYYNFNQKENKLSELTSANIEALADNESSSTKCCPAPGEYCYSSSGILANHELCRAK